MKLSKYEKETILRFCEDPEEPLTIFTCSKALAKKLLRAKAPLKYRTEKAGVTLSWTFEVPVEWFREPRPPRKRSISSEMRSQLQERAQAMQAARKLPKAQ